MKATIKDQIQKFLKSNSKKRFEKCAEPSAVAYETYSKTSAQKTNYFYFTKIYNQS